MIMNDYCLLFRALLPVSLQEILAGGAHLSAVCEESCKTG